MTARSDPTVDELMAEAFSSSREPRSGAYKAGVRALLQSRSGRSPAPTCPFGRGTAEADAFWAGAEQGKAIWSALRTSEPQDQPQQQTQAAVAP